MINIKDIKALSDEQIIEHYKKNAKKLLVGELYKRYTKFIFFVSMKYLKNEERSKDAVMEIFEKLFTDLLKHDVQKFKPWLHTVVRNHCLIILRKDQSILNKNKKYQIEQDLFVENDEDVHLLNESNFEEKEENLTKALNYLKDEQKECIELFYLKDKSYNQIAESTGYSIKKIKSYIQNGKRNLKIKLSKMVILLLYFSI